MRRSNVLLVVLLVTPGCIATTGPSDYGGTEGHLAASLEARLVEEPRQISWTLQAGNDDMVSMGCGEGRCGVERVFRFEALQADGSWVERALGHGLVHDEDLIGDLQPGDETAVAEGRLEEPGLYRGVVRVTGPGGPVDVGREVVVQGWPTERTVEGVALLDRAVEAECPAVARRIWEGLLRHAEPEDVTDLFERADGEHQRWVALEHMLVRGSFVDELSIEMTTASMDDVVGFGYLLSHSGPGIQEPLRALVCQRLLEPLDRGREAVGAPHLRLVGRLIESWPDHAPEVLVARLEEGPERAGALAELIDTMVYAHGELFSPFARDIRAALETRCDGAAEGTELGRACERARLHFDPDFQGGFGRGFGVSCRCGGYMLPQQGACTEILSAFSDLVDQAGAPRVRVLDGAAWPVAPPGPAAGGAHGPSMHTASGSLAPK